MCEGERTGGSFARVGEPESSDCGLRDTVLEPKVFVAFLGSASHCAVDPVHGLDRAFQGGLQLADAVVDGLPGFAGDVEASVYGCLECRLPGRIGGGPWGERIAQGGGRFELAGSEIWVSKVIGDIELGGVGQSGHQSLSSVPFTYRSEAVVGE